ncbi:MAG: putative sulfate exporter family transporter [Spirochaetes bacterium]|nr:putative sulfate exporter family transporter [Spirochaetota bacterium]
MYGNSAGDYATIVKLTRTIMIIPIALLFVFITGLRNNKNQTVENKKAFQHNKNISLVYNRIRNNGYD